MDRELILQHLKQAERHVAEGERVLEHQRTVIDHLRRDGGGDPMIDAAERLLHSFEEVQRMHLADRDRLRGELTAPT